MHGNARILLHVVLEHAPVFGVLFVEQHAILLTRQAPRKLGRTRVIAQLTIRVHFAQDAQVVSGNLRQIVTPPKPPDAFNPLAGPRCLVALQVVQTEARMGIEIGERLLLARHQRNKSG
ncbi:hypothetical protein D3C76_1619160 [compost metagenome]